MTEAPAPALRDSPRVELRRRLVQQLVFRAGLITFVLGATLALNVSSPESLASPASLWLFAIIGVTYLLTLVYALRLRKNPAPERMATLQTAGDLVVTTALVHVTGGAQSGYAFVYLLSIVGAATVHHRRGAIRAGLVSLGLFVGVSLLGWYRLLPAPAGAQLAPWDFTADTLVRQLGLTSAAFVAVAFLASKLGEQLASAGARLESQEVRSADLAAQSADIIRCLTSGLVTVGSDGRVLTFNEAAGEILGVAPAQARGRPMESVVPELAALLARAGAGRGLRREVLQLPARGGKGDERVLGVSVSPLTNHLNRPIGRIVNFQDLTELRRMEAQVKRAERLAAIGQMAAGVAHEIRNPLASISGSIELLRKTPQLDPDSGALMEIVLREVERLNRLITDLLDYARPRPRVPVPLELGGLLDETVRVFAQDRTAPGVTARYVPPAEGGEVQVVADPGQVRQVLWNLLRNAAEAMPDGGEVVVALRRGDGHAEFDVVDTGQGIAPSDQERLFEPFFTTKTRGSGLGLAMVHRIVTEHGGSVSVDSSPGRGARFSVRLPYTAAT